MAKENDIVLIYHEDRPATFARIEEILPDAKPEWYHVRLLMLQIPLQTVTWILRDVYIDGQEFTMDGERIRMERVVSPEKPGKSGRDESGTRSHRQKGAKVISFKDPKTKGT
jgi:hypothetical protein